MTTDPAAGLSVLHVIVRAGATNSQYNEHCLPVLGDRRVTVCSLFPAEVSPPPALTLFEGDGTVRGCFQVLRRALHFGSYDVVHVHAPASGVLTLAAYLRDRRPRNDLVFTVHNSWRNFRPRNRLFLRLILALFPVVVVCGRAAHDSLPRRLRRRRSHKLAVVPNGVDVDRIDAALAAVGGEPTGTCPALTVVSVNRLIPLKDPSTLLEAFSAARGSSDQLLLVGDGPLRPRLQRAVTEARLDRAVTFTGIVPRDDVYRILATADVFVSTSRGEGLPVALLEAMACGCPVVVSDIEPHREIAEVAGGVPLVPVGDVPGFARALTRLLVLDAAGRKALGQQLRSCVLEHFSVRAMNHAYGQVYVQTRPATGRDDRRLLAPAGEPGPEGELPLSAKLRRRMGLLVLLTVLGGIGGFSFAHLQTPVYKGETTLTVGGAVGATGEEDALKASAALAGVYADLSRREPVLGPVAAQGFAGDWRRLQGEVHAQVGDKNPQLVQISAYASSEDEAERLATAVAEQLTVVVEAGASTPERKFLRDQMHELRTDIESARAELEQAQRQLEAPPAGQVPAALQNRVQELRATLLELQKGYAEIQTVEGTDNTKVYRVDSAWATRSPLRPTPLGLLVVGAAAGFALAVGWVHLLGGSRNGGGPVPVAGRINGATPGRRPDPAGGVAVRPEAWAETEPLGETVSTSTKGNRT
jgi:glycosyltransferase involved in cell wall biosynthesis